MTKPRVLIVDDHEHEAAVTELMAALARHVTAEAVHPRAVTIDEIEAADLVLVDFVLDDWDELSGAVPSMAPRNGLALASVLRSSLGQLELPDRAPTLFALHSAEVRRLSRGLPEEVREWAVARLNDLEWVFAKVQHTADAAAYAGLAARVASLARSRMLLPSRWPDDPARAEDALRSILDLGNVDWAAAAWRDVSRCHPPIYELAESSESLSIVHWLAHRILPYPCFLLDEHYLAARLHLDVDALAEILDDTTDGLGVELTPLAYTGALHDFLGARWWRAGVEQFVSRLADGSLDITAVRSRLAELTQRRLLFRDPDEVVCIDDTFRPMKERARARCAVRVQPDDWPPYADPAWARLDRAAASARLRARVVPDDQDLLPEVDDG